MLQKINSVISVKDQCEKITNCDIDVIAQCDGLISDTRAIGNCSCLLETGTKCTYSVSVTIKCP